MSSPLVSVEDYEKRAAEIIPAGSFDYFRCGAGDELTLGLNRSCFERIRIRTRVLRSGSKRDMKVTLFGEELAMPIGIAPSAMQQITHPEGEVGNARAAASRGVVYTLSTVATYSLEQVAAETPGSPKWFQLYIFKDRTLTESLVRRAEKAGFKAIVLTVDAPMFGIRRAIMRNKFSLPPHLVIRNLEGHLPPVKQGQDAPNIQDYMSGQLDPTLSWDDVKWLQNFTKLPVIVKGILSKEDAILAADAGVQGIWVSNHGARQLDSVPATIEALPEIAAAVGDRTTIFMDGGINEGTDVFKALALGAKMVFIGKPALWGLAVDGQQGVENVLDILRKELDLAMAFTGCQKVADIGRCHVAHESEYYKF
ncbi:uncharacterized protein LOC129746779 [Uranotaenia lowii]|uniref:uncharacterized protein LOC129746779 n=1 Tax=Uranotaenia lowii TaxID=190385 RepID=UPI00247A6AEC|nr:uncharacterized protein LOC129746779 [Uranotaenia lowii]